ncbi:MAG: DUF357 domain-containing protein [Candidatus Woesearchaeota archaeon]
MQSIISEEKLKKYFFVTEKAFEMAKKASKPKKNEVFLGTENSKNFVVKSKETDEILDMASRYISDAKHFEKKGDIVAAFAALNYAHGWLDCGARLGYFDVKDSKLFTVDDK